MLKIAEHDLAGARAERQRAQVIAVEAAHACAERSLAERHRGLFDRGRKYDVEADDPGAAVDDRGQHLADLARPGDGRRAVERRRAEGLLIERHHDRAGDPQPGGKRMSRLTTGVLPVWVLVLALASTLKRLPSVAV